MLSFALHNRHNSKTWHKNERQILLHYLSDNFKIRYLLSHFRLIGFIASFYVGF